MKWWNDVWLNESFATYMSHKILDRIRPEWELWSFFVARYDFDARKVDSLVTTHPVEMQLRNASEMNEAFDYISYNKGASILRMIEEFIGGDEFRHGVTKYIRAFSYSNASSEDLWNSLEESSAQPVSEIMRAWLRLPGFPIVSVRISGHKLIFEQKRFLVSGGVEGNSLPDESLWPIPVIMELNGNESKFLFSERTREVAIPGGKLTSIVVNARQSGFYCVEYDATMYDLLENRFDSLSSLDKSGLLNDLSQLFVAGRMNPETFYRFVAMCFTEDQYSIVFSLWRELELFSGIAENSPSLREVNSKFLKSQMGRLGFEARDAENPNDRIIRELVSYQLAKVDDDFAREMSKRFGQYDSLAPELKSAVAVGYARTEGAKAYDDLIRRVRKTANEVDREKLYVGLGSFRDPQLIQKFLDFTDRDIPRSDIFWALYYSSRNTSARRTVWNWIKANFDRLWDLLGSTLFVMNLLDYVLARCAVEDEDDARSFLLSGERVAKGELSFRRQLELLHVYANLRKRLANEVS